MEIEEDRIQIRNMLRTTIRDRWIFTIDKRFSEIARADPYYHREILILYEPDISSIDFRSLFNTASDGYPISIEDYIKHKLRRFNLIHYMPILELTTDPIGLNQYIWDIYIRYHEFNEFERDIYHEWDQIIHSGLINKKISELIRNFDISCIVHIDRSSKDLVNHEKVFYTPFKSDEKSVYEKMLNRLHNNANFLFPYCEYIVDPRGLKTQVFAFGITRDKKKLSPRFNKSFKSSK